MTSEKFFEAVQKVRHWLVWVLVTLVIVFAFQNQLSVTVRFLFWNLEISRFALIAITFLIGGLCGFLSRSLFGGKKPEAPPDITAGGP